MADTRHFMEKGLIKGHLKNSLDAERDSWTDEAKFVLPHPIWSNEAVHDIQYVCAILFLSNLH